MKSNPTQSPDELPDFMEELVAMDSPDLLAPAILAEESRLFLTDDFGLRLLASNVLGTKVCLDTICFAICARQRSFEHR